MYTITVVRYSLNGGINRHLKGAFKVQFNTLSEVASFIYSSKTRTIYYPCLRKELTKKEYLIFLSKYRSLDKKHYKKNT